MTTECEFQPVDASDLITIDGGMNFNPPKPPPDPLETILKILFPKSPPPAL